MEKSASPSHISKHLPVELLARAEIESEQIRDSEQTAELLFSFASCFAEPRRTQLLNRALTICKEIKTVAIDPLGRGVLRLPEPHRTLTLERLLTIADKTRYDDEEMPRRVSDRFPNEGSRARALAIFVKCLRAEYASAFILQIPDYLASVSRLNGLAQSATLIDTFVDRESVALKLVNTVQETCDRWK